MVHRTRGDLPREKDGLQGGGKGGAGIKKEFHLTEPVKISMLERGKLVRMVEKLVKFCEENFPTSIVLYVEMYPRFVEKCCEKTTHMTNNDPWVLVDNRR